jgi:hypothetical protein
MAGPRRGPPSACWLLRTWVSPRFGRAIPAPPWRASARRRSCGWGQTRRVGLMGRLSRRPGWAPASAQPVRRICASPRWRLLPRGATEGGGDARRAAARAAGGPAAHKPTPCRAREVSRAGGRARRLHGPTGRCGHPGGPSGRARRRSPGVVGGREAPGARPTGSMAHARHGSSAPRARSPTAVLMGREAADVRLGDAPQRPCSPACAPAPPRHPRDPRQARDLPGGPAARRPTAARAGPRALGPRGSPAPGRGPGGVVTAAEAPGNGLSARGPGGPGGSLAGGSRTLVPGPAARGAEGAGARAAGAALPACPGAVHERGGASPHHHQGGPGLAPSGLGGRL